MTKSRQNNARNGKTSRRGARRASRNSSTHLKDDGKTYTLEMSIPRTMYERNPQNFRVLQNFSVPNWFVTSTTNPTYTYVNFTLSQIDQYATFVNLFDQYRIDSVEVWITPQVSADVTLRQGMLFSVLDFDDSTALTSVAAAQDYSTCVTSPQTCGHYRHFKPRAAMALYAPSAFTNFGNIASPWIDTSSSGVTHYGVKVAASPTSVSPQTFDLSIRYHITFRAVR